MEELVVRKMQIFVKTLTGKTITFEVQNTETVEDVKKKILDREGIEIERQSLVCLGKPLKDDQTLQFYDIHEEATLHLFIRLPGG